MLFLHDESLSSNVFLTLTVHLSLGQPHFTCTVAPCDELHVMSSCVSTEKLYKSTTNTGIGYFIVTLSELCMWYHLFIH